MGICTTSLSYTMLHLLYKLLYVSLMTFIPIWEILHRFVKFIYLKNYNMLEYKQFQRFYILHFTNNVFWSFKTSYNNIIIIYYYYIIIDPSPITKVHACKM